MSAGGRSRPGSALGVRGHSLGQVIDQVATRYVDARWAVRYSMDLRLRRTA